MIALKKYLRLTSIRTQVRAHSDQPNKHGTAQNENDQHDNYSAI